ncbi:hypothetical protein T552_01503 [Pneumocystis carinii B80]|uniref:RING-type domain-containing protein n=1 Tax=Pneumocystis carinii (strain B80) TaxID=1408658 RepID=A0A0W4ZKH7_PNEC8|nr:hypothetical protein T552_01503 [Pneumocystis carinii B80]KTW28874.1 hypothetical protein T552_01503 [Pneumocystis carinii B80]
MKGYKDNEPSISLEKVVFPYEITVSVMEVKNNILVMGLGGGGVLRMNLEHPEEIQDLEMPYKYVEVVIERIFLSPNGKHLIVGIESDEYIYFEGESIQGKVLTQFKGLGIRCIAWNNEGKDYFRKGILLGSYNGNIYEANIQILNKQNKYVRCVYQGEDNSEVIGLYMEELTEDSEYYYIVVVTERKIEYFMGKKGKNGSNDITVTQDIFSSNVKGSQVFETKNSQYSISPILFDEYSNNMSDRYIGWISESNLFYGSLKMFDIGVSEKFNFTLTHLLMDTVKKDLNLPFFFCFTHYHIILVKQSEIYLLSRLNHQIVFSEKIPLALGEKILGLVTDTYKSSYWVYSKDSVYEIVVSNEDCNIWDLFLKNNDYIKALKYAKKNSHYDIIYRKYGMDLIKQDKARDAAKILAKTTFPIEEIALKFISMKDYDSLRIYLLEKLSMMKKGAIIQKTILSTWLLFLYITKMNTLEDIQRQKIFLNLPDTTQTENKEIQNEFREFINKYKNDLNREASYYLINSHGRQNELLMYAESINDYSYILKYWIRNQNYDSALDILNKQDSPELIYKYASVLILQRPKATVDIWMLHSDIDPLKLIPAIIDYNQQYKPLIEHNQTIRYLFFVIDQTSITDSIIHNTLLSLLASSENEDEATLLQYLEWQKSKHYYTQDFALRTCIQYKRILSSVYLYFEMNFFEEAIDLALEYDNVDLATTMVDKIEDNQILKKKLWIKIAKKVIIQSDGDTKRLQFLMKNNRLCIEDLILLYPDSVKIDDFKEDICSVLKDYSSNIDFLLKKMEELTQSADNIRNSIQDHNNWFVILNTEEECNICRNMLLNEQFYVFPCQHCFHKDCLFSKVSEDTTSWQYRRIQDLQSSISKLKNDTSEKQIQQSKKLAKELDDIISSECILCGNTMIRSIDKSFIDNNTEMSFWNI